MSDPQYFPAFKTNDLPQGKSQAIELDGRDILVCHSAEGYFAVDNLCSHAMAKLSEGRLKGNKILCPLHGAAFDIRDGSALTRPAVTPLNSYPVKVEGDEIFVCV